MIHHVIEVALWMVAVYGLGCLIGGLARHWWARRRPAVSDEA